MKRFLLPLLTVTALGVGALYWISDNLNEIVADSVTRYGSAMIQARVGVEHVEIQRSTGKGVVQGLFVGNPSGFKTSHALRVERIEIDIDLASLTRDVAVVRTLMIDKPDVIYEKGESGTNFDAIQANVAKYLGPSRKPELRSGPRLIVEELTICNATAHASAPFMQGKTISIPLPDIVLKNIGASKGGVTPGELGGEIVTALRAKLSVSGNFDRLRRSAGEALDKAGAAVKGLFK